MNDFIRETIDILSIECMLQRSQLVQDATKTPDITFMIVGFVFEELGRHVLFSETQEAMLVLVRESIATPASLCSTDVRCADASLC